MSEKKNNEGEEFVDESYTMPSALNMASYGLSGFYNQFTYAVFNAFIVFFYEVVVSLGIIYILLAMIIFTIWDAINDPLIGHITDRNTRFTRKIGKRFPWIILGILPANLFFVLLFMPPPISATTYPWPIFGWMVFTTCSFDSLFTLCFVHVGALFPDKFRSEAARRKARLIGTPIAMVSLPISQMIPPLLIGFGDRASYATMAIICALIALTVAILFLPGMIENKEIVDRYYMVKVEHESFVSALKSTLKQRSFIIYTVLSFGFAVVTGCLTGSIPYAVNFVLRGEPWVMTFLFAFFLTTGIISIPFWIKMAKKIKDNKKIGVIGGIVLTIGCLLTAFYTGIIDSIIYMSILGFTMGNFWALMTVIFSDVLDERTVLIKSDQRGATVGISNFLNRFARAAQIGIFAIVHILTGFVEGATSYEELAAQSPTVDLAVLGIRLHMSVIPAIVLALCTLVFWKFYPLTGKKSWQIKNQLKELGL